MAIFLPEVEINRLLTMPMAIEAVETVLAEVARGEASHVPRERVRSSGTTQHLLQGHVPSHQVIGYKVYTVNKGVVRYLLYVYDARDGHLDGILEAGSIGRIRTGAASGVATQYLANKDAHILGVFGCGRQAAAQIEAVCLVRPITEVKIFSRNKDKLAVFCGELSAKLGVMVRPAASAEEAVRESDVVTTITNSEAPVFDGAWVKPGTHINAVGSNLLSRRELDEATLERCSLIVTDSREVAKKECGDLLPMLEKGKLGWGQISELGEVIIGHARTRTGEAEITCYESHGTAVQDLIVGARLLTLARQRHLGVELPLGM